MMAVVVVDNSNMADMLFEAGVESPEVPVVDAPSADKPTADKPQAKEGAPKDVITGAESDDPDDVEDEEGVTLRQKRELSAKMLKAIGKKHRQVKEAEEFAAHQYREKKAAEDRASELERQLRVVQEQSNSEPKPEEVEPKREAFESEVEYIDAKINWGISQGIKQREAETAAIARQQQVEVQYERAAQLVPDFVRVTNNLPTLSNMVVDYMRESEMFAELGYHLAKNHDVAAKLLTLTPAKQLVELGKIEAKLQPFGSNAPAASPKADETSDNGVAPKAAPSTHDTGFSPSKARSDAPVIKPISGEGTQVESDVREMNTRQMIEKYQRDHKVNLHVRKRH